jgi:hypothetical protein
MYVALLYQRAQSFAMCLEFSVMLLAQKNVVTGDSNDGLREQHGHLNLLKFVPCYWQMALFNRYLCTGT